MAELECHCNLCAGVVHGANGARWSDLMAEPIRAHADIKCCYYIQGRHDSYCKNNPSRPVLAP
jgi:hypothetical protein